MKKLILVMLLSTFYTNAQIVLEVAAPGEYEGKVKEVEVEEKTTAINWQKTFKEAVTKAKKEHKPILIYFTGSDWCGPCIQLDENLFHTDKFIGFSNENLVLYVADYPRNRDLVTTENKIINKQLSKKYQQESFPTMIMVDENGKMLGRKNGAYLAEYYYPFFEEIVKNYK